MKKILLFVAAAAATFALSSCEKSEAPERVPDGRPVVELCFGSAGDTRAFGSGTTEAWEKQVHSAVFYIFDAAGNLVFRRDLTSAEINTMAIAPIAVVVPGGVGNETYDFVVTANRPVPASAVTKALLSAELETDGGTYNGTFSEVTTSSKRSGGFAMSGITTQALAGSGTTSVAVVLKRVVSKVEISAHTTAAFAAKYGAATVTINKVTVSKASAQTTLLAMGGVGSGNTEYEQVSSGNKNLFYLFDKGAASAGSRVLLTLAAVYDADGSNATTADRRDLTYEVEMAGVSGGQILRNGAYLVDVNIDGVLGLDVTATVTVANWETLVTESIHVGK